MEWWLASPDDNSDHEPTTTRERQNTEWKTGGLPVRMLNNKIYKR